ncbi:hypothetical protein QJQ45_007527 [Haematococcus lacustris]|nr:hypothetical protein QJQ45_007527 [Haematococcus lacustris]
MYTGPSPFSALDSPELTAFVTVAGPISCLVCNGSGHLALQPHGNGSLAGRADGADSDSEDKEVGSRLAAADMETAFGELEEEEGAADEPGSEPVQLSAIPPRGRWAAPVPASDFQWHVNGAKRELAATAVAVEHDLRNCFLQPEHVKGLAVVYAHYWDKQPSDEDSLERQAIVKAQYCMETTLANGQRVPALLDQHYLDSQPITRADISEFVKLAQLALVMTPGSV